MNFTPAEIKSLLVFRATGKKHAKLEESLRQLALKTESVQLLSALYDISREIGSADLKGSIIEKSGSVLNQILSLSEGSVRQYSMLQGSKEWQLAVKDFFSQQQQAEYDKITDIKLLNEIWKIIAADHEAHEHPCAKRIISLLIMKNSLLVKKELSDLFKNSEFFRIAETEYINAINNENDLMPLCDLLKTSKNNYNEQKALKNRISDLITELPIDEKVRLRDSTATQTVAELFNRSILENISAFKSPENILDIPDWFIGELIFFKKDSQALIRDKSADLLAFLH